MSDGKRSLQRNTITKSPSSKILEHRRLSTVALYLALVSSSFVFISDLTTWTFLTMHLAVTLARCHVFFKGGRPQPCVPSCGRILFCGTVLAYFRKPTMHCGNTRDLHSRLWNLHVLLGSSGTLTMHCGSVLNACNLHLLRDSTRKLFLYHPASSPCGFSWRSSDLI